MDIVVFLIWLYCGLSWFCMMIYLFTPQNYKTSGRYAVRAFDFHTYNTPFEHVGFIGATLTFAPLLWLILGIALLVSNLKTWIRDAEEQGVVELRRHH